jgi:hypothetical protein
MRKRQVVRNAYATTAQGVPGYSRCHGGGLGRGLDGHLLCLRIHGGDRHCGVASPHAGPIAGSDCRQVTGKRYRGQ